MSGSPTYARGVEFPEARPVARRNAGLLKWTRYGSDVLAAWVAEHDLGVPPEVTRRLRDLVDENAYGYHGADNELGGAFSRWATSRHGWTPEPELVVPTSNVLQGIWACIEAFTQRGDGLVYTTPVYPPFLDAPPTTGRRAVDWPMVCDEQGWGYDIDALQALLEADAGISLLLLCSPHNPTGRLFQHHELVRIVDLAHEHDLLIVSDEIHSDIVYPGSTHIPTLTIPGAAARTVTVTSGVKTFALGGLRCAVAVAGNDHLQARLREIPAQLLGGANRMGCEATIAAWENGGTWVDSLLTLLDGHRRHLVGRLHSELPRIGVHLPDSTFLAWLDLGSFSPGENAARWLRERTGVACGNGPAFGPGGRDHVRMTFGTTTTLLDKMVDQMVAGLIDQ